MHDTGGEVSPELPLLAEGRAGVRRFFTEEPLQALGLLVVTATTALLAVRLVDQPVRCDEAGTYLDFVRYGLRKILTDYSSPNNHILHSLAAKVTTKLFGPDLWALRLPALIGGVLLAPASYLMVRAHFGRSTALLGSALIATCPYLVDQATNARGYTMMNFAFLCALALAPKLLRSRRLSAWFLLALVGALGVYTLPVMGYPLAIVFTWMAISGFADLPRSGYWAYAWRTALAIVVMVAVTGLLYAPTYFGAEAGRGEAPAAFASGGKFDLEVREKVHDPFALPWSFCQWLAVVWRYATHLVPRWLAYTSVGFASISVLGGRRAFGLRFFAATGIGVFTLLLVIGRRPPLWSLSFLVPLYWTAVAVGVATLVRWVVGDRPERMRAITGALALGACVLNASIVLRIDRAVWTTPWYFGFYDADAVSRFIDEQVPPNDPIAAIGREMITVRYYQEIRGDKTPGNERRTPIPHAEHVYVIDSGVGRSMKLRHALEVEGFEPDGFVESFQHSSLVRYKRVRESPLAGPRRRVHVR